MSRPGSADVLTIVFTRVRSFGSGLELRCTAHCPNASAIGPSASAGK